MAKASQPSTSRRETNSDRRSTITPELARRRRKFGNVFAETLQVRRKTQMEIAEALGTTQSSVSAWKAGESVPDPETIFQLERELQVPPGHLGQHLGFVPANSTEIPHPARDAIMADPLLDEEGKRVVMAVYEQLTAAQHGRGGRRGKAKTPAA